MTPNLGESIENLSTLESSELAWSTKSREEKVENISYDIIYEDKNLIPWQLIKKK